MTTLIAFVLALGCHSQTVTIWSERTTAGEFVRQASEQSGTQVTLAVGVEGSLVCSYLNGVSLDSALAALCELLDLDQSRSGGGITLKKRESAWTAKDAQASERRKAGENLLRSARAVWKSLPLNGDEAHDEALLERWRSGTKVSDPKSDDWRLETLVFQPEFWPLGFLCSQLDDREFQKFLDGWPVLGCSVPAPGVAVVRGNAGNDGKSRDTSWTIWYDKTGIQLKMLRYEANVHGVFYPYNTRHDLFLPQTEYSKYLEKQQAGFDELDLPALLRNEGVKKFMRDESAPEFCSALGRSGHPVLSLFSDIGRADAAAASFDVQGIAVIKPSTNTRLRPELEDSRKAMPVALFRDPVLMFTRACELIANDSWATYAERGLYGIDSPIGDFEMGGDAFAQWWLSLRDAQRRSAFAQGIRYSDMDEGQRDTFARAVYRSVFNSVPDAPAHTVLNPGSLKELSVRISSEAEVFEHMSGWSTGSSGGSTSLRRDLTAALMFTDRPNTRLATVGVGYRYTVSFKVRDKFVGDRVATVEAEIGRGSAAERTAALEKFLAGR